MAYESGLNLKATELRLGLPGSDEPFRTNKRPSPEVSSEDCRSNSNSGASCDGNNSNDGAPPPAKTQIVGWPPVRASRKNILQLKKNGAEGAAKYVKVSMDGAPYLRKIDLKVYKNYSKLLKALENMFKFTIGDYSEREGYCGSDYMPTYEDKDGDCMLVGDVPWEMFISSCKKLRIVKGSQSRGLGRV